jgi:hypothetical protein
MAKSKFQNYDTETIHRSQIKNAPYNPRIMNKAAQKRLRNNIRKHGLVSALTWNRRTGNLVGGHQRLEQLDALEKSEDYDLTVCVVDVDEREEAALNVQLNNPSMQGDWDLDKLAQVSEDFDLSMTDDLGFTQNDVDFMFDGDERFSQLFDTPEANDTKDKIDEIKRARAQGVDNLKEKNSINWYAVVVFADEKDRDAFFKEISVPKYEEYITAEQIRRIARNKSGD